MYPTWPAGTRWQVQPCGWGKGVQPPTAAYLFWTVRPV